MMDALEIFEQLRKAIKYVYRNEHEYFRTTDGRERSMVFRIAHRLANQLERERGENKEKIFVDIEATRCEQCSKRDSDGNIIIPDLIVHLRDGTSYLVVEFKCGNREEDGDIRQKIDLNNAGGF